MANNILVAPLNWGLGHATRCIPIIKALRQNGFTPILASDGEALVLLKKEFPELLALELPSYQIEYPKTAAGFLWKMAKSTPKALRAIAAEQKQTQKWVEQYQLCGIVSDNRLGVCSKKVPSVFITHQLRVLSGKMTRLTTLLHGMYIRKFDECWVPDGDGLQNLSGKLGHLKSDALKIKYIGWLSRLEKKELPLVYDFMVLLSGPEPQRSLLEEKLTAELMGGPQKVVFVKGKMASEQSRDTQDNITFYNFMQAHELEQAMNQSGIIICRSGYTTLMDLAHLQKKALLIPTPGQFEQEYLAQKLQTEGLLPMVKQHKFKKEKVFSAALYPGLPKMESRVDWEALFGLFKGKGKL